MLDLFPLLCEKNQLSMKSNKGEICIQTLWTAKLSQMGKQLCGRASEIHNHVTSLVVQTTTKK